MKAAIGRLGVLAYAHGFTLWHYRQMDLPMARVLDPNFFGDLGDMMASGDQITIAASDGGAVLYVQSAASGAVTVEMMNSTNDTSLRTAHDKRVTDLLVANNREIERRRTAEAERDTLRATVEDLMEALRGVRIALIEQEVAACTECGSRESPKQADCSGCSDAVDDQYPALSILREIGDA